MAKPRFGKSDQLLAMLAPYKQVLIVTHDNPDPDAIAAGWAIQWMIETRLGFAPQLIGGGAIVRAENQQMVRLLGAPIRLVQSVAATVDTAAILVDCGFLSTNHLLASSHLHPVAVIDHHQELNGGYRIPFRDVRPQVAASTSIAASYLREQELEPSTELATAMLYAMHTETRGSETHYSSLDRCIFSWLTKRADPSKLAEIENAPLSREYFADLALALQNTFLYEDAAFCLLPRAQGPETVGEVADLLVRCANICRVLCGAVLGNELVLSVRTDKNAGNAAQLCQRTIDGLGHGGGHEHRAGGKIINLHQMPAGFEPIEELRSRWLAACAVERRRGTRLVAKREIVGNL